MDRASVFVLAVGIAACASQSLNLSLPSNGKPSTQRINALLRSHPLPPGKNILAVTLGSTEALSYHLVQIRDRESPHVHAAHDLVVTLVQGTGELHLAYGTLPMNPGDTAVVPRGVRHLFVNLGAEPAAAFVTFAPPYDGSDHVTVD